MGRHSDIVQRPLRIPVTVGGLSARSERSRAAFSFWVALAIVLVSVIAPDTSAQAASAALETRAGGPAAQRLVHAGEAASIVRDGYRVTSRPVAPAVGTPDPGSAQAIAWEMMQARGWGEEQYSCLVALWTRESNWNAFAMNPSSGAYGIPQAVPGEKMASAGADWATNPVTQITWGLGYIAARYATPCGAWEHSEEKNWY